jgi:hypothetical protein
MKCSKLITDLYYDDIRYKLTGDGDRMFYIISIYGFYDLNYHIF